jgi:hypothetical protein
MPSAEFHHVGVEASPEQTVAAARQAGWRSIAYTYLDILNFNAR